jgi:hypothetical protein
MQPEALGSGLLIAMAFELHGAWPCVIAVTIAQVPLALIGILSAALRRVTPNEYRGRTSALFLLFGNVIRFGFGPLLPALITDHVFADGAMLGRSIALVALVSGVAAALILWAGCRPLRAAVADARRWTSHESPMPGELTEPPDERIATDPLHTAGLL